MGQQRSRMDASRSVLIALVVATAAWGCSSDDRADSDASPAETISTVETAETTAAPQEVSNSNDGQRYLEIVNPVNCASSARADLEAQHSLGNGTVDPEYFDEMMAAWREVAEARQVAYRALLAAEWPSDVAEEVTILAKDWAQSAQVEQQLSEAADVGIFNAGLSALLANPIESQGNPGYIRALLGLGPSEETDRC